MDLNLFILGLVLVVIGIVLFTIVVYNTIIELKNNVKEQKSGIEVQLKKKVDLLPNLIKSVEKYAKHEKETLNDLTNLRENLSKAVKKEKIDKNLAILNDKMNLGLEMLSIRMEAYPDLKASNNYQKLQEQLAIIEEDIAAIRRIYNSAVNDFNTYIKIFPNFIIANYLKEKEFELFETKAINGKSIEEIAENIKV